MELRHAIYMKNSIQFLVLLAFVTAATSARAATNYVILGDDIQAKINTASPRDTMVVQAGVYPGDVILSKPLTVLGSGTNQVQLLGTVQIQGDGSSYFSRCQFANTVLIQWTGVLSFAQCAFQSPVTSQSAALQFSQSTISTNFTADLRNGVWTNFQAFDSGFNGLLNVAGGKLTLKRCSLNGLELTNNAALEALRITNAAALNATAAVGQGTPMVIVQSSLRGAVNLTGYKAWLGYNTFLGHEFLATDCDTTMIGNIFNLDLYYSHDCVVVTRGSLKAFNNAIFNGTWVTYAASVYGILLNSAEAEIANNIVHFQIQNHVYLANYVGIGVMGTGGAVTIRDTLISLVTWQQQGQTGAAIQASGRTVNVSYCLLDVANTPGVVPLQGVTSAANCLLMGTPLGGGPADRDLPPGSPCINAGSPNAIYNDRDGTRNDIGFTGGPYYNPANYTNNNPMVFFLTGSPQTVLKGVQTNIQVNAAASAGH